METLSRQDFQIRAVKAEDMSSISDLEQACFNDPFPSYFLSQLAEANPDTFLVAVSNGQIIGYAVVDTWSDHQHLVSIAVHEQSRRKGIGQALLDELVQQIRNSPLRLEVRRRNKVALDFYLKNGFRQTGVSHSYYADGEDAIQMEKQVEKRVEILAPA